MNAEKFLAAVESGEMLADSHDRMLRVAYIYLDEGFWSDEGVFTVVEKLHDRGWSFGKGHLRFNR